MTILWDHCEQKDRNMMIHPKECRFEVSFTACFLVFAVIGIIGLAFILIAAGSAMKPVVESLR